MKRFDLAILIIAVAIVAGGVGFAIGHGTAPKVATASSNGSAGSGGTGSGGFGGGQGGGGFRRGFGTRGTVTAVSGNTITLTDQTGAARSINVTSTTTYMNGSDQSTASLSDVTTGVTILASGQTGSGGAINATRIIINPPAPGSFGGGGGSAPSSSSSGTSVN